MTPEEQQDRLAAIVHAQGADSASDCEHVKGCIPECEWRAARLIAAHVRVGEPPRCECGETEWAPIHTQTDSQSHEYQPARVGPDEGLRASAWWDERTDRYVVALDDILDGSAE